MPTLFEFLVFVAVAALVLHGGGPRPPRLTLIRGSRPGRRGRGAHGASRSL